MSKVNVRKRNNKWQYQFEGAKIDGKRKQITKSGFRTKKEALDAGVKALAEYNNSGFYFTPSEISYSDFLDYWIKNYVEVNLRPNTIALYKIAVTNIKQQLGIYKIKSITPNILQDYINSLFSSGTKKDYLKKIVSILNLTFKYAVFPCQYIKENPAQYISFPKYEKDDTKKIHTISIEEFNTILERFPENSDYHMPLVIGFYTGMRIGEILALTWNDVNFENKTISVNKALILNEDNKQWYLGPTKTFASNRIISIGDTLLSALQKFKEKQNINHLKYNEYYKLIYTKEEFVHNKKMQRICDLYANIPHENLTLQNMVCCRKNGELLTTNKMKYVSKIIKYELNIDFRFHCLRHTHATLLIENGANIKDVQTRLGHSNIQTTLDTYTHSTQNSMNSTVNLFEQILKK